MRSTISVLASLAMVPLLPGGLAAQAPGPPAELDHFDAALGNWKGEGTYRMSPEGPESKWTSISTWRKVYDGFAVQEDARIDLGPEGPAPLVFRTLYGWDPHREAYVYYTMGNVGYGGHGILRRTGDGRFLTTRTHEPEDEVVTDQTVFGFTDDEGRLVMERSVAGSPFFRQVEGTYTPTEESFDAASEAADQALAPVPDTMDGLFGPFGAWKYEGEVRPMPGSDPFPVSGTETIRPMFGGHVHASFTEGDEMPGAPRPYRGAFYVMWNPEARAYASAGINNYSGVHFSTGYRAGDREMVFTSSMVYSGSPMTDRTVVEWDEAGDRIEIRSDHCAGTEPCQRSFHAVYEPVEEEGEPATEPAAEARG